MLYKYLILICLLLNVLECTSQTKKGKNMENNNPMLCNPETGMCEMPDRDVDVKALMNDEVKEKPIRIVYYTDPICSACWGIEGALRKMKLEYGDHFTIEYRMGGLLPAFGNGYNAGGISSPADVAKHWDEASDYYQMPIDGDVWYDDPLSSSFPSSIAFKVAELQDEDKAIRFLRVMREMLFLQKRNISKWEVIEEAARRADLDIEQLKKDYQERGADLLQADLNLSRDMGVRGFPTLYFFDDKELKSIVYGSKPYSAYEVAILETYSGAVKKAYSKDVLSIMKLFGSLTIKELSVLGEMDMKQAETSLTDLEKDGILSKIVSRKGNLWYIDK